MPSNNQNNNHILQKFQFAKLKLEEEIRKITSISHSIVRPTAFFKSLDGQIESVQKGLPILYFGDGTCAANAISEKDLANYLITCAINPEEVENWKWMKIQDVKDDMILNPDIYTVWFKIIFDEFYHFIDDHKL